MISALLIENDFNQIWQFKKACSGTEFSLKWAHDSYSAYKKFLDHSFDIVISRVQLPHDSGFNILKTLRKKFPNFKSLLLSQNYLDPNILSMLKIDGQTSFPCDAERILRTLRLFDIEPKELRPRHFLVRSPRISFERDQIPLDIRKWGKVNSMNFKGELIDISSTGMGLITPKRLNQVFSPEDLVSIRPPQMRTEMEICGKIVYSQDLPKKKHTRWGILFREPISVKELNQELCLFQQFN